MLRKAGVEVIAMPSVLATGRRAVIGSLEHIEAMLAGQSGTEVCVEGSDD